LIDILLGALNTHSLFWLLFSVLFVLWIMD